MSRLLVRLNGLLIPAVGPLLEPGRELFVDHEQAAKWYEDGFATPMASSAFQTRTGGEGKDQERGTRK